MERSVVLDFLRLVLIAFVIAFVINLVRIATFGNGDFSLLLSPVGQRSDMLRNPARVTNNRSAARRENHVTEQNVPRINSRINDLTEIPLEKPMCFNGMSKSEVLNLRRKAVKTSPLFSDMNYEPSSRVFNIGDGLPWISLEGALHFSKIPVKDRVVGASRESVGILNPELLYYLSTSENEDVESADFKTLYKDFYFIPYKVTYNKATKTITAYIKNETKNGDYQPIFLSDSNANDLGYKYAYMDKSRGVGIYSDQKYSNNSLKKDIKEISGYYTIGSACGYTGGCNNYAPYWQYYNHIYLKKIPASFNIKLWKNRPQSVEQKADINFEMIFESSN